MVLHIVGARPQFIKLAPVANAFKELAIPYKVLHTGQHYDYRMSDMHFETLAIDDPDYALGIGSGSHAGQTAKMLEGIETVLVKEHPSLVLVYGDTNSTLSGALCAAKMGIPVGHVEAGVRSFDRNMPEEINRVLTDHISRYHFCPTHNAMDLLKAEGITGILTGDVMYDALLQFTKIPVTHPYTPPFVLTTIHRAENTNEHERFRAIWEGLERISTEVPVIFPVHPRTRDMYPDILKKPVKGISVVEPVSYLHMLAMIRDSRCIVTDSGGVQKEAFLLKSPCITVRDTTEWPETVEAGANMIIATDPEIIFSSVMQMMHQASFDSVNPFGDGKASYHIARFIQENCL
ncbi:MAG TPA: UDP-N-acetylglucosamine 2-epimerase (non-hydrolyzing) [Deltaproteobacteria bacterium]|nr:UDP-N-acetylglucosamine 2-epimerase (non-hydrolyzing) [Deltaproteobacteria bacterium]HPJ94283.1 UDP-N-acetylglucosamine 2-epimerase (non-hydrolyzing) [Deltaproteobacteria bacterium]HPR52403.1 UDP-N-acetylglucosamine 2-epimerase (non-hydrolyzing) [Deltaproteobacteria bacterium]